MKIAIIGHSYVQDLERFAMAFTDILNNNYCQVKFYYLSGSCFNTWIAYPPELRSCIDNFQPNIIFTVLRGNSIKNEDSLSSLKSNAYNFFFLHKFHLPSVLIVDCQVENRYLTKMNRKGTPPHKEYSPLRKKFNKFLHKCNRKDFLCMIAGSGRLDNPKLYKADKTHLNLKGVSVYWNQINRTITYLCYGND